MDSAVVIFLIMLVLCFIFWGLIDVFTDKKGK